VRREVYYRSEVLDVWIIEVTAIILSLLFCLLKRAI
jgi:hypothetical protein